jgi:hypothetical protein
MCVLDMLTHLTFCRAVLYPELTPEEISKRFDNAGPSARYCLEYSNDELESFYARRDPGIDVSTPQDWVNALLDDEGRLLRIDNISRRLCVVRHSDSEPSSFTAEPISAVVRRRLLIQLWRWNEQDRSNMIERFSHVPGANGMTGLLFESQSQSRFAQKISDVATPMFQSGSRWHAAFGDFSATPTLCEARDASSALRPSLSLSISPWESRAYDHGGSLTIEEKIYYLPYAENETAIDSFIMCGGHLYIFLFAGSSKHCANRGLLATFAQFSQLPAPSSSETALHLCCPEKACYL